MRTRSPVLLVGAPLLLLLLAASPALAARLVGGRQQAAIRRAFTAQPGHRHRLIVSIRASTVSPSWAAVSSVTPERAGRTSGSGATPRLQIAYYHRLRPAAPPPAVRSDLGRDFKVAVVYTGTGAESIVYDQAYRSVCAGAGGFTDQQAVTVDPMSWTVRYVVDLDNVVAAVHSSQGTTLVPNVTFAAAGSSLDAVESLSRTQVDTGCNGKPAMFNCRMSFHLGGSDPAGRLTLRPDGGIEVGIPMAPSATGTCDPTDYTLGPSLWDGGASAALVGALGLVGGTLPANPYAPVRVSWPGQSAQQRQGFATSPCQGDGTACADTFAWHGTVALKPVPGS